MADINDDFFKAYWTPGMRSIYKAGTPADMIYKSYEGGEYYEWKPMPGTLTRENYKRVEEQFNVHLPESFIQWHKAYFFEDGDCSIIRLPYSHPARPLAELKSVLDWYIPEQIIPHGLIPFATDGNDIGTLVFDTRNCPDLENSPIRLYDHEYMGNLDGVSEVIFSSFSHLLKCLTHFLREINYNGKNGYEAIPEFYRIDPDGAGSSGRQYWDGWIEMMKQNY